MENEYLNIIIFAIFLLIIIGIPVLKILVSFAKWGGWKDGSYK